MTANDDTTPRPEFTQQQLASLATSDSGWTGDNPKLSNEALNEIHSGLNEKIDAQSMRAFLSSLQKTFREAVEISRNVEDLRVAAEERSRKKGQPSRPPVKLAVKLRDDLGEIIRSLNSKSDRSDPRALCIRILANEPLERLTTPLIEERMRPLIPDPLRNAPEETAALLPAVLDELAQSIAGGVRQGRFDPANAHIAKGFVRHYSHATGLAPGRTHIPDTGEDRGPALEALRVLARELWRTLPEETRPDKPPKMTKQFRTAVEELKSNNEVL